MMWTTKKYLCALLFGLLSYLPASDCIASSATCSDGMVPKATVLAILNDWEQSNNKLLMLLNESDSDLKAASEELILLKKQLAELRIELTAAQDDNKKSLDSLAKANAELQNIAADFKQLEKQKNRVENQRTFWQIIAAIATGVAIAK